MRTTGRRAFVPLAACACCLAVGCPAGEPAVPTGVQVEPSEASVAKGLGIGLTARLAFSDGTTQDVTGVAAWESSDGAVVEVSAGGRAAAKAEGVADVTASHRGLTGSARLTVGPPVLAAVSVRPAGARVPKGLAVQLAASGTLTDGSSRDLGAEVEWESLGPDVVTVDAGGLATGRSVGTAVVRATAGGLSGETSVAVDPPVALAVRISPAAPTVAKGLTVQLSATADLSDGGSADVTASAEWSTLAPDVATVVAGLVTAVGEGQAAIRAAVGEARGERTVTVTPAVVAAVSVAPSSARVPLGLTRQLAATAHWSDGGTTSVTGSATWASSNEAVAKVSGGLVSSVAIGAAVVSASHQGRSGAASVAVTPPVLVGLSVAPPQLRLRVGGTARLAAVGTYSDGSSADLTAEVAWQSSDATVARVSPSGLVSGEAAGSCTVRASASGTWAEVAVAVAEDLKIFVTSVSGTGDLATWPDAAGATGIAAADAICQARAGAAGLAGTFRAWISDDADDAWCRVHGLSGKKSANCGRASLPTWAGPWVRTDGFPFAPGVVGLAGRIVYTPPRLDEFGSAIPFRNYTFTDTQEDGDLDSANPSPCANWTSSAPTRVTAGRVDGTALDFTWSVSGNCSHSYRLLCMQVGEGPPLPAFASPGKGVFVTSVTGTGDLSTWAGAGGRTGVAAADAVCQARAAAAGLPDAARFKAWLSTSTVGAASRIASDGPWVRMDGVKVAGSKADLLDGTLFTAIAVTETGEHLARYQVWTGTYFDGTGTGTDLCSDWSGAHPGAYGRIGQPNSAGEDWSQSRAFGFVNGCDRNARLFCFED